MQSTEARIMSFEGASAHRAGSVWPIVAAFPLALLVAIASLGGMLVPSLYARESVNWAAQALGQDWVDLLLAVPWLCVSAVLAMKRSPAGLLMLASGLLYTSYTFVIYALGMHFNAMFLVYVAVLGISFFALAEVALMLIDVAARAPHVESRATKMAGYFLIAIAVLFGAAWLSDIVPAIVVGTTPKSIVEAGTPNNPVHVIDLSVILPLHLLAGLALVRRRSFGAMLGAVVLGFGVLMALSIAGMMVVMHLRGVEANLFVAAGMSFISLLSAVVLVRLLTSIRHI